METIKNEGTYEFPLHVASFLGSGINGNREVEMDIFISLMVASFLGSGINGNKISWKVNFPFLAVKSLPF